VGGENDPQLRSFFDIELIANLLYALSERPEERWMIMPARDGYRLQTDPQLRLRRFQGASIGSNAE
jgi:hypothetical protein